MLSIKIKAVYQDFDSTAFVQCTTTMVLAKSYTQRVEIIASLLRTYLPSDYPQSLGILLQILGPENPNEDGMFKHFYWILPIGKYVEKFGLQHYEISMSAIAEITKRNTGEYAVRAFIRRYPGQATRQMREWALSDNFHLRRLASEGLRPKLPWAPKLEMFIDDPQPVF